MYRTIVGGGIIYQYLGVKYCSPTIGMYFFAEEYIKFLKKFDYYLTVPMKVIKAKESRYYKQMIKKNHQDALVGVLDDVEIVFLHYNDTKKIIDNWEKRKNRINYDCIIFKFCDQNECTDDLIYEFDKLPYKNKICFTHKNFPELKSTIWIKKDRRKDEVVRDYYKSHKYLNIINYINEIYEKNMRK